MARNGYLPPYPIIARSDSIFPSEKEFCPNGRSFPQRKADFAASEKEFARTERSFPQRKADFAASEKEFARTERSFPQRKADFAASEKEFCPDGKKFSTTESGFCGIGKGICPDGKQRTQKVPERKTNPAGMTVPPGLNINPASTPFYGPILPDKGRWAGMLKHVVSKRNSSYKLYDYL